MLNPANAVEFILPADADVETFMERMKKIPNVGLVFEDIPPELQVAAPNDPAFGNQWNLTNNKYGIDILQAWDYTMGSSSMRIGLLDAGIRVASPGTDLANRFDLSYSNNVINSNLWVYNGIKHGYAVAGVIGAHVDNGVAIAGIDENALMVSRDFIHHTWSQRIEDIMAHYYAGAPVLNLSFLWASPGNYDLLTLYYLGFYYRINGLPVAAMGNADLSTPVSPSRESFTLSVAGHNVSGSHYGRYGEMVDLSAPAVNIPTVDENSNVVYHTGTSLAAAHVSGVASLLWSYFQNLDADDVANVLKLSAVAAGDEDDFGDGTLNARRAFDLLDDATEMRHIQGSGINNFVNSHSGARVAITIIDENDWGEVTVFNGYAEVDTHRAELLFGETYSEPPMVWGRGAYSTGRSLDNPNFSTGYTGIKYVTEDRAGVVTYRYRVYEAPTGGDTWFATPLPNNGYAITVLEKPVPFAPEYLTMSVTVNDHPKLRWPAAKEDDFYRYQVWRKTDPDPYASPPLYTPRYHLLATTTNNQYTDTEFDVTPQGPTDVWYKVRVIDDDNNASAYSPVVSTSGWLGIMAEGGGSELIALHPNETPDEYALGVNYPNPANPTTLIQYSLPEASTVQLTIYNMQGQIVRTLVSGETSAGRHQVTWDGVSNHGQSVASGVYIYRLRVVGEDGTLSYDKSRKLLLMK